MIHTIIKYLLISATLFFCSCHKPKTDIITPAKQLIERQIGERAQSIHFEYIEPSDGKDIFEVIASDGRLTLRGSSSVAICYAFHTYMKEACKSMKTWSGEHITSVMPWPDYELYEQVSPYELRYFLNVCTFGYTTPYWDWERWEKEIDRMALYGVNMPLATVASEAIAERVWLRMGLNKEEIREFFTAPAHLPWHRMGNLNKWDGPLSDAWQQNQIALQHQILTRMRELGMQPIAPAFAGFVPEGFVQKHPDTQFRHMRWGGFDEEYNAYVLPPDSPFFEEIGKLFVEEWEKEFGENTYYLSDSFNEMELPIDKEDKEAKYKLLAEYGETIYKSIAAGNPDAVWVTQGWTFGYQHSFWDKESLKALLSNVPDDKMIIIDLGNDYPKWVWNTEQTWKVHDGFYGKKWIFSYVPNFGGKNTMTGDLDMYASSSVKALRAANKGNLIGFGSAPEGLENNEVVYELLADMGWSSDSIDLDDWMKIYCEARYGGYPDAMEEAWKLFRKTAYSSLYSYPRFTWQTVISDQRRISKIDLSDDYLQAIRLYASCADELKSSELYRNDLIEFVSYYVAAKAENFYKQALKDDSENRVLAAQRNLQQTVDLLMDVDRLLASHPLYRLEEWVELARNSGTTLQEKDAYEANAKRLITSWGGIQEDYAARFWSGLIKDYYIPRIQLYFTKDRDKISHRDHAAGLRNLGDEEGPVLGDLHNGEAQVAQAGDILLAGFGEVAASDLAAALQEVAHHGALAQLVPVLQRPAEGVDGGGHEDGGVGYASGDDHVGALLQGFQNTLHAHVGVGGDDLTGELGQGLVGLPHLGVHVLVDDGQQIVAGDAGDLHAGQAVPAGNLHALLGSGLGIGRAHVGDELHLVLPAQGKGLLHAVLQKTVVSLGRVLQLGLLPDGDGALGQALIADIVQVALFDQLQ